MKLNWEKMGFKSVKEYNQYMKDKNQYINDGIEALLDRIRSNPKLLDVFKHLKDK